MTPEDMERGPVYNTTVTAVAEGKASRGWLWRLCGVLLIAGLCAAAALLFAWCQHGRPSTVRHSNGANIYHISEVEDRATN